MSDSGQKPNPLADWTTRIDPSKTVPFGIAELHAVAFEPDDDHGGERRAVMVQIPETTPAGIAEALRMTHEGRARLCFLCDTREQAVQMVAQATAMLPRHRRIAYERAEAGGWGIGQ